MEFSHYNEYGVPSVKSTWTVSAFSTNESSYIAMVKSLQPYVWSGPNTNLKNHSTPNAHQHWFILFYHVWGPAWIETHWNSIQLRARSHVTSHYMMLEVCWDGLSAFSFRLSQFHDYGSWLLCEVGTSLTQMVSVGPNDRGEPAVITNEPVEFEK